MANVGPPSAGGHFVGEPVGIEHISITHEMLTIDLRPLSTDGLAQVEAVYHLQNQGEKQNLNLLFAAGSKGVSEFQVFLDNALISSTPARDATLPESWQAPKQTPGIQNGEPLAYRFYGRSQLVPMAFTVTIPPGASSLRVRYAAEATKHFFGHPTVYRQFAYVLAPARSWAGFGRLDVSIHLPKEWKAACTPDMTRRNDVLTGSFQGLPADAISLTVQAPPGWAYEPTVYVSLAIFGLSVLGGAFVCGVRGRSLGRRQASAAAANVQRASAWIAAFASAAAWSFAVLASGLLAVFGPDWVLPFSQVAQYGYGQPLAIVGVVILSLVVAPLGFAIVLTLAHLGPVSQNEGRQVGQE